MALEDPEMLVRSGALRALASLAEPATAEVLRRVLSEAGVRYAVDDAMTLRAVNDALYASCVTCHQHYRPNYGRGRP